MFKAGFSSRIITPKEPVWLGGYAARNKASCGVHDDLYVKAFYISDGTSECVLVSCDIVYLLQEQVDLIREKASELYGIKNVSISATHTHSGPEIRLHGETGYNDGAQKWIAFVQDMVLEAIGEAIKTADPIHLFYGAASAPGVAKNRRSGESTVDETLMVFRAEDMNGNIKGIIVNFPCHCTVLDANNYLISADYPGFLYQKLSCKYEQAVVMFFNGACGNINIGYSADASALGTDMGGIRTFRNAEKKADILLEKVYEIIGSSQELEPRLLYHSIPLELPLKDDLPSIQELRRKIVECDNKLADCTNEAEKDRLGIEKVYCECLLDNIEDYHIQGRSRISTESVLIGLGNVLLVTVPLELFCEIGLSIKEMFSYRYQTFILGYTNGYYGYFPTKRAHQAGGYECETSVHNVDSEDYLLAIIKEESRKLFDGV